jgi:hypothetical protein
MQAQAAVKVAEARKTLVGKPQIQHSHRAHLQSRQYL